MKALRARWVMPSAGTHLANGWITALDGRVEATGVGAPPVKARDLGDVVVLPGLVNAHTHLELSWLDGRVPPQDSMDEWISTMMRTRRTGPAGGDAEMTSAIRDAITTIRATGTVLVGDISNTLASVPLLDHANLAGVVFHEILGFRPVDPAGMVREAHARLKTTSEVGSDGSTRNRPLRSFSVVAHAPYSTSPALFREIATRHEGPAPLSVHLAESNEEMEFLQTGRGPLRDLLERLEVWDDAWTPPGAHPVRFMRDVGYLPPGTLLVHGVHLSPTDLDEARDAKAVLVTCPRSNVWVGGGVPPVARFYASGVNVAIGTDSLASVDSLSLFDELAALRRLAPEVEAARFLDSATRVGAEALGYGSDYGSITRGKRAAFVAVQLPHGLTRPADVEEYLVSGVPALAVSPVDLP
jgi:cytosine/adenosine deaminase-related metal-dependent hydrolase